MYHDAQCINCYSYVDFNGNCPICGSRQIFKKRAIRREQTQKIINYRKGIVRFAWQDISNLYYKEEHRLAKYNLSCNCWMCKGEKHGKIIKKKYIYSPDYEEEYEFKDKQRHKKYD